MRLLTRPQIRWPIFLNIEFREPDQTMAGGVMTRVQYRSKIARPTQDRATLPLIMAIGELGD